MARVNKYVNEFVVQELIEGKYHDSCHEDTMRKAKVIAKDYRANGYTVRVITRRVENPLYQGASK